LSLVCEANLSPRPSPSHLRRPEAARRARCLSSRISTPNFRPRCHFVHPVCSPSFPYTPVPAHPLTSTPHFEDTTSIAVWFSGNRNGVRGPPSPKFSPSESVSPSAARSSHGIAITKTLSPVQFHGAVPVFNGSLVHRVAKLTLGRWGGIRMPLKFILRSRVLLL
jgi:hypothetical protein